MQEYKQLNQKNSILISIKYNQLEALKRYFLFSQKQQINKLKIVLQFVLGKCSMQDKSIIKKFNKILLNFFSLYSIVMMNGQTIIREMHYCT
jgi:hypothetical protein